MIIHKLHIQDWKHLLEILNNNLFKMNKDYDYFYSDEKNISKTIKKLADMEKYLDKINNYLLEEGTILTKIKNKIIQKEGKTNYQKEQISHDKEYYKDVYPKFLQLIPITQKRFHDLKNKLETIKKDMHTKINVNTVNEARNEIELIERDFITIEGLSNKMARDLNKEYKDIKEEIESLKKEENMFEHINHNIESWFLH